MGLFNDTVTIFNKRMNKETAVWDKTVVNGVQWSDTDQKNENAGRISVGHYVNITFPEGTYDGLILNAENEEDAIFYGKIDAVIEDIKGHRITDIMKQYPKSGRIKSVNDNSNRDFLKNVKVVIA
ncbi:hypothetical protein [uncultured Streptococcus sp.]|uniref:hypothetical protein n=1 Tax=uncultured Streptococcus sp. TaxID=83427 RepID=UPI0025ECFFE2|nr:hypothetical protein [uncultured Streptococcus sp.]